MEAAPCHDVGLPSEDAGGGLLQVDQLIEPDRAFGMVKKQIDVRVLARFASGRRAEQVQVFDAKLPEFGGMGFEFGDCCFSVRARMIAWGHTPDKAMPRKAGFSFVPPTGMFGWECLSGWLNHWRNGFSPVGRFEDDACIRALINNFATDPRLL